jgi:hypothetical protein
VHSDRSISLIVTPAQQACSRQAIKISSSSNMRDTVPTLHHAQLHYLYSACPLLLHVTQLLLGIEGTAAAAAGLPEVTAWLRQHSGTNFCSKLRKVRTACLARCTLVCNGLGAWEELCYCSISNSNSRSRQAAQQHQLLQQTAQGAISIFDTM